MAPKQRDPEAAALAMVDRLIMEKFPNPQKKNPLKALQFLRPARLQRSIHQP